MFKKHCGDCKREYEWNLKPNQPSMHGPQVGVGKSDE